MNDQSDNRVQQNPPQPQLCRNGCGFYGDIVTGLCSKCFKELKSKDDGRLNDQMKSEGKTNPSAMSTMNGASVNFTSQEAMSPTAIKITPPGASFYRASPAIAIPTPAAGTNSPSSSLSVAYSPSESLLSSSAPPAVCMLDLAKSRCAICSKKLGLLGFHCRCDRFYCSMHRHADAHQCTFDYKAFEREQLAKGNPTVSASKLDKI